MKIILNVAAGLAFAALPCVAQAQSEADFAEAQAARDLYDAGDLLGALEAARVLADQGNPVASNVVGAVLTDVGFAGYDPQAGMAATLRSAAAGFDRAWYNLGIIYIEQHAGIAPNDVLAALHFDVAADMGYVPAMEELGYILTYGSEEVLDYARARDVIETGLAAEQGNSYLPGLLGDHYYFGFDTDVDLRRALALFEQGAAGGNAYSQFSSGYGYYFGEGAAVDFPKALAYFEQAAAQDYVSAYGNLAEMWYEGYGVEPDYVRSLEVAQRGVDLGDAFSQVILGQHYDDGNGVPQDYARARQLYTQAYEDGEAAGLENLGDMAYFGSDEGVDYAKAYELYQQAFREFNGRNYAGYSIGYMLLRGEGVEADPAGAVAYLENAFIGGYQYAAAELPIVFGHPDFAGPQSDPILGMAYCFVADQNGYLEGDTYDETVFACDTLEQSITIEQAEAAIAIYQTF